MPKPNKEETESKFIGRCMADDSMCEETPDSAKRVAACQLIWDNENPEEEEKTKNQMPEEEIQITGAIGDIWDEDSINGSEALQNRLDEIPDGTPILVKINSPGGSVFEGFAMYNALKAKASPITTQVDGLAASIASLIALAGERVKMSEVSMLMIHNASTMAVGDKEEMEKQMETLKSIDDTLVSVYAQKSGETPATIKTMMDKETFMTSQEALDKGFIDEIVNKVDAKMAARLIENQKAKLMSLKSLFAKFRNETSDEVVEEQTTEEVVNTPELDADGNPIAEATEETTESEFATKSEVEELKDSINQLAELLTEKMATKEDVAGLVADAIANVKTGLKQSTAKPTSANNSVTGDATKGWVDPYAKFRAEQNEIENKTRL